MKVEFKTRGFRELDAVLKNELPLATARNVLKRTALNAMKLIETRAKGLAPRETGRLEQSITTAVVKAKRSRGSKKYDPATGVTVATGPAPASKLARSVAGWQERGTVEMAAHPYMRPAVDGEGEAVVNAVGQELAAQIEKARKRIARKLAKAGTR